LNDPKVVKRISSAALSRPRKGLDFVEESFLRFTRPEAQGFFIWHVPSETFIGTAKLDNISRFSRTAWDGIMIGDRSYQGRGFAKNIYRVILAYGFTYLDLFRISGGCNEHNFAMIKTFRRIGYRLEGRLRCADLILGKRSDHLYFGILKKEFEKKQKVQLTLAYHL